MRIVVTGGAGFIGANLVKELLSSTSPPDVLILDDLSTGASENLEGITGVELLVGSVTDPTTLDRAFRGADAIVHLAAVPSVPRSITDPGGTHLANTVGTFEVLEAARRAGNPHLVIASSSSVYGANPALPKHEGLVPEPVSPYAASKLAAEAYAVAWAHSFDMPVLAFRFFNVFGPLQSASHAYAAVIPAFVSAAVQGRALTVHGDGSQTRDFTYVSSVTRVLADAVARRVTSPTAVNLAFGSRSSLLDVIGHLEAILGNELELEFTPPRPGDVHDSQADQTRLHELFPDVTAVPLREGLEATVGWFRQGGAARDA